MPPPATVSPTLAAHANPGAAPLAAHDLVTTSLLNAAHALDHLVLLVFATAVGAIAIDFGFARWEDLMPYATGSFLLFGLGSVPAGRLGDHWGRRAMMLVFLFGIGATCLLVAATQNAWQMALGLTLLGAFASIYHPVGIPMLVQSTTRPGAVIAAVRNPAPDRPWESPVPLSDTARSEAEWPVSMSRGFVGKPLRRAVC